MKTLSTLVFSTVNLIAAAGVTASTPRAHADLYQNTESCVLVFVKEDVSQPNLTVACDGTRLSEKLVPRESSLADAAQYKRSLYEQFQLMVNTDGKKGCSAHDLDAIWWAACSLP